MGGTNTSQLCSLDSLNSNCLGGGLSGTQLYTYQTTITMDPACDFFRLDYNICCRPPSIVNVQNAGYDVYFESILNLATDSLNSTPFFTAQAIPYLCANQASTYNFGVVETDGDSLVYSLVSSLSATGSPVSYITPFLGNDPISGIVIDPNTGQMSFTPALIGSFVVVVQVHEYDRSTGALLSTIRRDALFIVNSCTNLVPNATSGQISNFSSVGYAQQTGTNSMEMCEGSSVTFSTLFDDPDAANVLSFISNTGQALPGAIISSTGTNPLEVTVDWTAPVGSSGKNYNVIITINDDNCSTTGIQIFSYSIRIIERTLANPLPQVSICSGQDLELSASGGTIFTWYDLAGVQIPVDASFSCNPCNNPTVMPLISTDYVVVSDLTGACINADTVSVLVIANPAIVVAPGTDTVFCTTDPIYTIVVSPFGGLWSGDVSFLGQFDPSQGIGNYTAVYTIGGGTSCEDSVVINLNVYYTFNSSIQITTSDSIICAGASTTFNAVVVNGGNNPQFQWKVNGVNVGTNSSTYSTSLIANGAVVTCELTSSLPCSIPLVATSNPIGMTIISLPIPSFTIASNNLTAAPLNASFTNTTANAGNADFVWTFGDGGILFNNNSTVNHTYMGNGVYHVGLAIQDPVEGCSVVQYDPANANQSVICNVSGGFNCNFMPLTNPSGIVDVCVGGNLLVTANSFPLGSLLQWNKDGIPLGGETGNSLTVLSTGYYSITCTDLLGCAVISAPVNVNFSLPGQTPPLISSVGANGACGNVNATLTASGSFATYLWSNGQTGNAMTVNAPGTYTVIGQGVGCDALSAPVNVTSSAVPVTEVCMITVDPVTDFHSVVWEKPISLEIDSFFVYKEVPYNSSEYFKIGAVGYDSLSEFEDVNSDAGIGPNRYKISILDTCGGESAPSNFVRSIHLQVAPGVGTARFLSWSEYRGQSQNISEYIIFSGSSISSLTELDSVFAPTSFYVDDNPVAGLNTVYLIESVLSVPCESNRAVRTRSRSNGTGNTLNFNPDGMMNPKVTDLKVKIQPNPNKGSFEIVLSEVPTENFQWWIEDLLGSRVTEVQSVSANRTQVDLDLISGLYFVKVRVSNQILSAKIICSE